MPTALAPQFTVPSAPPSRQRTRFSKWAAVWDEARANRGQWLRVDTPMRKSTASQLASDIRNAWKRDPEKTKVKSRLQKLRPDEKWDAVWGQLDGAAASDPFYIWIRYDGKRRVRSAGRA